MHLASRSIAVLGVLATLSAPVLAQPAPPVPLPAPAPVPPAPAVPADGSAPASADPATKPTVVEIKEPEAAKTAALTPIIPKGPGARGPRAFQLYAEIDVPLLSIGLVFAAARIVKTQKAFCAPLCDKADLNNPIDRLTANFYSANWSLASDIMLYGMYAGAAGLMLSDEGFMNTLNDGVVVAEATLSATAIASVMTLAAGRPRPFLFGDPNHPEDIKAPLTKRNSADAGLSFLSSHTSMAFAIATSLYLTEHRLHRTGIKSKIVLGVGLTLATAVGVSRVMAGYHFITDVVGGAIVGTSTGVLVASLHGSPISLVPVATRTEAGLGVQGSF